MMIRIDNEVDTLLFASAKNTTLQQNICLSKVVWLSDWIPYMSLKY